MQREDSVRPLDRLIFFFTFLIALIVVMCLPISLDLSQHEEMKRKTAKLQAVPVPKQTFTVNSTDCWIKNFHFTDKVMLNPSGLSDAETVALNGSLELSKKISVRRNLLVNATIDFQLSGVAGYRGWFNLVNTEGRIDRIYSYKLVFDKSGVADISALILEDRINRIYEEAPEYRDFYLSIEL